MSTWNQPANKTTTPLFNPPGTVPLFGGNQPAANLMQTNQTAATGNNNGFFGPQAHNNNNHPIMGAGNNLMGTTGLIGTPNDLGQIREDLVLIKAQIQSLSEMWEKYQMEGRARQRDGEMIHHDINCDGCGQRPIIGPRYKCLSCPNFDLCESCERVYNLPGCRITHDSRHFFGKIRDSTIFNLQMNAQQQQQAGK